MKENLEKVRDAFEHANTQLQEYAHAPGPITDHDLAEHERLRADVKAAMEQLDELLLKSPFE